LDQYLSPKIKDTSPDKFFGSQIIRDHLTDTIRDCKLNPEAILKILGKEKSDLLGYENLVSEIIDSPLDVDRMDYLVRDALLTGLSLGTVNIQALIARMGFLLLVQLSSVYPLNKTLLHRWCLERSNRSWLQQ
jgi:HD superfamily phosphohydrolase